MRCDLQAGLAVGNEFEIDSNCIRGPPTVTRAKFRQRKNAERPRLPVAVALLAT